MNIRTEAEEKIVLLAKFLIEDLFNNVIPLESENGNDDKNISRHKVGEEQLLFILGSSRNAQLTDIEFLRLCRTVQMFLELV